MFETMQGFLMFFIPMVVAIVLGIIFEQRLIAFERRLVARLRKQSRSKAAVRRQRPALKALPNPSRSQRKDLRKPAA